MRLKRLKAIAVIIPALLLGALPPASWGSVADLGVAWSPSDYPLKTCFGWLPRDYTLLGRTSKDAFLKAEEEGKREGISYRSGMAFEPFQKQLIREAILSQFTPESTGISFYGFQDCVDAPDSRIAVIPVLANSTAALSILGKNAGLKNRGGMQLIALRHFPDPLLPSNGTIENQIKIAALHEFGHAAGLHHEHFREEAAKDPYCKKMKAFGWGSEEEIPSDLSRIGTYDQNSVMSYCFVRRVEFLGPPFAFPALSAGDRHTLKCMYGPKHAKRGSCKTEDLN